METVAAKLPPKLVQELDALIREGRFPNRSEVLRVAVRKFLEEGSKTAAREPSVGSDPRVRRYKDLMRRVASDPRYRNRWVAVFQDRVIESDDAMDPLVKRVLDRSETPVQIGYANLEGKLPVARVPGVRVRRP